MTGIVIKPPSECSAGELDAFTSLVVLRRDVSASTLEKRIRRSLYLGFYYDDNELIGIVALKKPSKPYVAALEALLEKPLPSRKEVGWAYTLPEHRDRGVSGALLSGLLETCSRPGLFAVTRADNDAAAKVLTDHGFTPYGPAILWKGEVSRVYT